MTSPAATAAPDRLDKYDETDLKGLRERAEDARRELKEARDSLKIEGKNVAVDPEAITRTKNAVKALEEVTEIIDYIERGNKALAWLDTPDDAPTVAGADAAAAWQRKMALLGGEGMAGAERLTLGEMFTKSSVWSEMREKHLVQTPRPFQVKIRNIGRLMVPTLVAFGEAEGEDDFKALEGKDADGYRDAVVERKDIYTAAGGNYTVPAWGQTTQEGLIVPAYRTQRVRDLFPVTSTNSSTITFIRRTGYVNNARVVLERTAADGSAPTGLSTDVFGLKPPSNLVFETDQEAVKVIAHTIDVSKTVLDDEPRLRATIDGEMLYGLRLTEDAEILYGDGSGTHLRGIMNTAGLQFYNGNTGPAGDYMADQIRRALTLVMLAYYESTGVVMHPFDWEATELEKDDQGRYVLVTNVTVGAEQRIWKNPVVATPAMQQGQFLCGAFGLGAHLWDREAANIDISTETRDLFDRNAIAIRAEQRLAVTVERPESLVKGTFRGA